jgi:HK97 family phage portal protein
MGLFDRFKIWRKSTDPLAILAEMMRGGRTSKAGPTINLENTLRVGTAFACIREIAQGCAQVPFKIYKKGGQEATDHPLYELLTAMPNDWSTAFEFIETLLMHTSLGNGYAYKNVGASGKLLELIILDPSRVQKMQRPDYSIVYKVTAPTGAMQEFPAETIWHLRGPSWDGLNGLDIISLAREALGLSVATEESHSKLHSKGVRPSGIYSVEGTLSAEQHKALRKWIEAEFGGAENAGTPMILDRAAKWISTAMTGVDSQHLETRKFQIEEVCRFFGVFPMIVFHSDKTSTFASSESFFEANNKLTLSRWYRRIELSANAYLLTKKERKEGYYCKFNANALMRGSAKDRAEYYARALGSGGHPGWMTPDEVRALEEMNPRGGDADKLPPGANTGNQPDPNPA